MQYLIKWKGYPALENSWLLEKELTKAKELLNEFKQQEKRMMKQRTNTLALEAQQNPKEGILSWTQSMTSSSQSSKLKAPQMSPTIRPPRDSEKQETHAKPSGDLVSHDQTRNKSPNISCAPTRDKLQDQIRFGQATSPMINKWQIVETIHNQQRHVTLVKG
jgi:hypothetical protein